MIECIKNSDCLSGFCDDGTCRRPKKFDACKFSTDCPSGTVCHYKVHRCIDEGSLESYTDNNCTTDLSCSPRNHCYGGYCLSRSAIGTVCSTISMPCVDGAECDDSTCRKRCDPSGTTRFGCEVGEVCTAGLHHSYGVCLKDFSSGSASSSPSSSSPPASSNPEPVVVKSNQSHFGMSAAGVLFIFGFAIFVGLAVFYCFRGRKSKSSSSEGGSGGAPGNTPTMVFVTQQQPPSPVYYPQQPVMPPYAYPSAPPQYQRPY